MRLFLPFFRVASIALLLLSVLMLVPIAHGVLGSGWEHSAFYWPFFITLIGGLILQILSRLQDPVFHQRQLFLVTAGTWLTVPLFGMLPFMFMDEPMSLVDSMFESVSGMTTTGSTVMTGLDDTSPDILLWRSILQWFGGVGIIGMTIAVLPSLKSGGMRLFRTESSDWSEKETPRIKHLLGGILLAYIALSILCTLAYWAAGMSVFNAVNHMMTTVSTGGYSTSDASFGQFENPLVSWVGILFMAAGSIPMVLYIRFWSRRTFDVHRDPQVRGFLMLIAAASLVLATDLLATTDMGIFEALTVTTFNVVSVVTTTGFASADYMLWGSAAITLFYFLTFVGGCSGSTAGGIKIFRFQIFAIMLRRQLRQAVHPNMVIVSKYGTRPVSEEIIQSTVAFMFLMLSTLVVITFALSLTGLDFVTSITGASTALMNVGPGLGDKIGPSGNFKTISDTAKCILVVGMIMGRLEFTAILIIFTRTFWRA